MVLLALAVGTTAAQDDGLTARVETWGRYYRAGEPVLVRIVVENPGEMPVSNRNGLPLLASLELSQGDGDGKKPAAPPAVDPKTQPQVFDPGSGHLMVTDLAKLFSELATPGYYTIELKAEGITSEPIELMVAHPYNENADYTATLKTDHGNLTFDLLESAAPDHVRNFVDLARQGFYTGTLFHVIAKGEFIMGGSPPEGDPRSIPYVLPPEFSPVQHERGTLSSVRTSANGPDNSVQFIIDLARKPEFDGKMSVFGKMLEGEETLTKLEGVATSLKNFQPHYKPLEDVVLREVVITEKP
jgi:cyclophilin family peptidyl-prolyl cis-trans isomerase